MIHSGAIIGGVGDLEFQPLTRGNLAKTSIGREERANMYAQSL